MPSSSLATRLTAVLSIALCLGSARGLAGVVDVTPPVLINTTTASSATIANPRWKGYMHPTQPDRFWAIHGDGSSDATNMVFTTDGGDTWHDTGMQAIENGYLDYHASLFGFGGDLYVASPSDGVKARRWLPPAQSNDSRGVLVTVPNTETMHRSVTMVDGDGRWWIFTRLSGTVSENVRYTYSDNRGETWHQGVAYATGHEDVRFGAMPLQDGTAVLVVLYLTDDRGYEYYKWNGTSFVKRPDAAIWPQYVGWDKSFTHNVVGSTMHLVFRNGDLLQHAWKEHDNGNGPWNYDVVPVTTSAETRPVSTVRGNELYLFYNVWTDADQASSSAVRAIVWNQATQSWGDDMPVSTSVSTHNEFPNTCFKVPAASDYVPVIWTAGAGGTQIMFAKLVVSDSVAAPEAPAALARLLPNYPNPFNPQTVVPFELPRDAQVELTIHDVEGRCLATLVQSRLAAGRHEVTWNGTASDGRPLPSGSYFARLQTGDDASARRLLLVR